MRNTIISILIFFGLLAFVYYADNSLQRLCYDISSSSEEIEFLISSDNWDAAYSKTIDVINEIKANDMITSIYLNHTDFDNLLNEAIKLSLYVRSEDSTESNVSVNLLKSSADIIFNLHKANIQNIF